MRVLVPLVLLLAPASLAAQSLPDWAQAPPPAAPVADGTDLGPGPPPPPPPPPPVPVDGGLGLLALAGAGYAGHRLRRRRPE